MHFTPLVANLAPCFPGIDLGSKKAVMGVVRAAGIDIILNDASASSTE